MADSYKGWLPTVASRGRLRSSKPVINLPSTRFLCRPTVFFFARVPYSSKKKRRRTAEESRTTICPVTGSQTNLSVTTILLQPHSSRQRLYIKSRQVIQTVLSYLRRLYYAYTSQHAQRQLSASKKHSRPATNLAALSPMRLYQWWSYIVFIQIQTSIFMQNNNRKFEILSKISLTGRLRFVFRIMIFWLWKKSHIVFCGTVALYAFFPSEYIYNY